MLIITNRQPITASNDGSAFSSKFAVDKETLAVADGKKLTDGEGPECWETTQRVANASDEEITDRIAEHFSAAKTFGRRILVYVHGNGYDYLECLKRCDALTWKYSGVEVIGFSWPSEGFAPTKAQTMSDSTRDMGGNDPVPRKQQYLNWFKDTKDRYKQASKNAEGSAAALTRALKLLNDALAQSTTRTSAALAIHSLGNQLFLRALNSQQADQNVGNFSNILLLAPCVDAKQQGRLLDTLNPARGVYVTFNKNDWVLAGAQAADGDTKLGLDPGGANAMSANFRVRYVDFEGAARGVIGHRYFFDKSDLDVATTYQFFTRTFNGENDISDGEEERDAYPFLCDAHGKVCRMGMAIDNTMPGG